MSLAMAGFYIASFVLLLTLKNVESAAYGESCTVTTAGEKGDCTDTHGACSTVTGGTCGCATNYVASAANACLLKAGQTCTANEECTTNSVCSTTCTCSANYDQQPSGLCFKPIDTDCVHNTDTCVADALCDLTSNKCAYKSGVICASGTSMCVTGATCASTSAACTCTSSSYTATTDGYCGLLSGKTCTTTTPCVDNAECIIPSGASSGTCTCKSGYTAQRDGSCKVRTVDTACVYSTDTCVTGALCDQTSNKCAYKSGVICATGTSMCVTGATCASTSAACTCTSSSYTATTDGYCGLLSGKTCTTTTPCVDNAECIIPSGASSGTCTCKSGYTAQRDGSCKVRTVDTACVYSTDTCVTGALCDQTSNKCAYKSGVICASGTLMCVTGATCASTSAACTCTSSSYTATTDGYCGLLSGKTCTTTTPCVDNAECVISSGASSGTCTCKSGFSAQTDGSCSEATGLVGSLILLIAAVFVTLRLR